ncbi:MAG: tetratricopeptide repeat protein [Patescibacteria group bacterium]|nr:tetratricopeptide repeat protein [Patescibacteria group bacterium]
MNEELVQAAISAALSGEWEEAILLNKKILDQNPKDVDALTRLARAYAEINKIKKAKATLQEVLRIDPYNSIAIKTLTKWKNFRCPKNGSFSKVSNPQVFLEEPGKTKVVFLKHLSNPEVIAELDAGDPVKLVISAHKISIISQQNKYIGKLPDDISARIKKLFSLGYSYSGVIISSDKNGVSVLIREITRPKKYSDIPSFPTEKINYIAFTPPELVHEEDEIKESLGEDEEEVFEEIYTEKSKE